MRFASSSKQFFGRMSARVLAALTLCLLSMQQTVMAATGGSAAPGTIDATMENIMEFMTGSTMITVVTIAVALAGLSIIFADRIGDAAPRFGKIILGGALLLSAPQIMIMLGFTTATL